MLADELEVIGNWLAAGRDVLPLSDLVQEVKSGWRSAVFSGAADHCLRRYFNYHLEGISEISDTLSNAPVQAELLAHLLEYYRVYLDEGKTAPLAYQHRWFQKLSPYIRILKKAIQDAGLTLQLKQVLIAYLAQFDPEQSDCRYSFLSLNYFEQVIRRLQTIYLSNQTETQLNTILLEFNFNHLAYYAYRQQDYRLRVAGLNDRQRAEFYQEELTALRQQPEQLRLIFDPDWPSLKTMLLSFLQEELTLYAAVQSIDKVPLNLSVAHLACLMRLLFETGCFADLNLQDLFRICAVNFRSKRQNRISAPSLSKEYYSITQVTAAVMRDKLLQMVAWINQNFFPV